MYIKDDFSYKERELDEVSMSVNAAEKTPKEFKPEQFFEIVKLIDSQYAKIKDKRLIEHIKSNVYPAVKYAANLSHGISELQFDENEETCCITLYSKFLFLNNEIAIPSSDAADILKLAESAKISIEGEYVKYQFIFNLIKKVQIADYSKEITELKDKIKAERQK